MDPGPRRQVIPGRAEPRPRPRSLRSGALFFAGRGPGRAVRGSGRRPWLLAGGLATLLATLLVAVPAAAQDPDSVRPLPDTLRPQPPDTAGRPLVPDTLVRDTAQDTIPPPRLPALPAPGPAGWQVGVWEWDRRDLLRLPDLSLLQLLERIPGVTPVRMSIVAQPEAPAVLGATAGAVRYIVDGFELDPLTTPTFDPSRLALLALARVRVERRVTGAVVRIETLTPSDPRPQSIIEAGTGDLGVNLFRGMFLAPDVLGGPLALGFERLASGAGGGANHTAGWLKWTFVRDSAGIQLEYRQSEMDRRTLEAGFLGERREWALRARARVLGVAAEAYAGATTVEDDHGALRLREGTPQAGLRAFRAFRGPLPVELRATARFRDHPRRPRTELDVEAWTQPAPWVGVGAELTRGWWAEAAGTGRATVRGRLGPVFGLSAFAEASRALPGAPASLRLIAPVDSVVHEPDRQGLRAGVSLELGGVQLGAAALTTRIDSVAAFGLGFDPEAPRYAGGVASGFEAIGRIPTGWSPLWLEGWIVSMDAAPTWLYLPREQGRAAVVYHHLPLPSGNLELYARAEYAYRGRMAVPCAPPLQCANAAAVVIPGEVVTAHALHTANLELTIRVITVRAFLRWDNILNRRFQADLPGLFFPGQRVVYGVKWELWN